ncbi:MAG: FAD-binding oxidoreductase [Actinomycetota bacterium]
MDDVTGALIDVVGIEHVLTDAEQMEPYSHDATFATKFPRMVIRPASTEDVAEVVGILASAGISITARGAGTGLSGGAVATESGAIVSLERLTDLHIDAPSLTATAGAGVMTAAIQAQAAEHGLMYPPDPASTLICTIGGNVATNAGGPSCLKYGVTAEYVIGLVVVLADATVLRLGGRVRKRSGGYRLQQLFIGSEGTLGIVTEVTVRLVPQPNHRATLLAAFDSVDAAAAAVSAILTSGNTPAACELIDATSLEFVKDLLPDDIPSHAACLLLIDQDGNHEDAVADEMNKVKRIVERHGAFTVIAETQSGRDTLWQARRSIGLRLIERRAYRLAEDIAVPIDKISDMVRSVHEIASRNSVSVALFGHAGDGNLHPSLLFPDREPATLRRVSDTAAAIFDRAIELGGTVSAEHGVGTIKRGFLVNERSSVELALLSAIKKVFDPRGLMNPGKVIPSTTARADGAFMDDLPGWLEV